jgi:L-cysteate sulfo-lyase
MGTSEAAPIAAARRSALAAGGRAGGPWRPQPGVALQLSRFPRVRLCHLPTPLEHLPRLSEHLGGPQIYVKRDDCTGLATGGNKTRKLEFLLAEAIEGGADTLITVGAVQSNHCRQTAAAAAKAGLGCHLLLQRAVPSDDPAYEQAGNVFLDRLLGADVEFFDTPGEVAEAMLATATRLRAEGRTPYFIPVGGSTPVGALGYVNCALELMRQAYVDGLRVDWLLTPSSSAGTHAGLVVGMQGGGARVPVLGLSTGDTKEVQEAKVWALARQTASLLELQPGAVGRDAVVVDDRFVGGGYGHPTEGMVEAVRTAARLEGLLFDPVYTGKMLAGLFHLCREGFFDSDTNVVLLHSGGSAGLFAAPGVFDLG